jgi:hypothetical protein
MGQAGRKPTPGVQRYADGTKRKLTVAEQAEAEQRAEMAAKMVVMRQPHRRGDGGTMPGSALGRFVAAHRLRSEYFKAGEAYAGLVRRLWAVKGVPSDVRITSAGFGIGPTDAMVRRWEAQERSIKKALDRVSPYALDAVREVAVFDRDIRADLAAHTINGLMTLAVELGMTKKRAHPFL